MGYVVLIKVIMNWWMCNVMFRYLLVLYSNVYGKISVLRSWRWAKFARNMLSWSWR